MNRSVTSDDWVALAEASRILGVSPATVRRWSDAGRLRVFTTPGGHRRFSRAGLERLLPADRSRRPSVASAMLDASRLSRTYGRSARRQAPDPQWLAAISDRHRARFRQLGRDLTGSLLLHLDAAPAEASPHLDDATRSATEYGSTAATAGLTLAQTVGAFLRYWAPFHHELTLTARRRGFDGRETADLLEKAARAMDRLLLAVTAAHGHPSQSQEP